MKETGRRGSYANSLEDLIKVHTQKPPKEMLDGVKKARDLMDYFRISSELGISGLDSTLFHAYLSERFIRTKIYDFDWITHSPEFDFTKKDIEKDEKDRKKLQESLDNLALQSEEIVRTSYIGSKQRIRARNLELAANDLVARASVFDEAHLTTGVLVSYELMENWSSRWRGEFKSKGGHARKKNLYYLEINKVSGT